MGWNGNGSAMPWMSGPRPSECGSHRSDSSGRATAKPYFSAPAVSTVLSWSLRAVSKAILVGSRPGYPAAFVSEQSASPANAP